VKITFLRKLPSILIALILLLISLPAYAFQVDSVTISDTDPAQIIPPPSHPDSFTIYDEKVFFFVDWSGYQSDTKYKFEFYAPDGTLGKTYSNSFSQDNDYYTWTSVSSSDLFYFGRLHGFGDWTVKFYYSDQLYHTDHFVFSDPGNFKYMSYVPDTFQPGNGILAVIHAADYDPVNVFYLFKSIAKKHGVILVAPYFDPIQNADYPIMFSDGYRADIYFHSIIDEVANSSGADKSKLYLYGHSAGGQFCARYVMAYPEKIGRVVISAPSTYTFPRFNWDYYYGLKRTNAVPPEIKFDLEKTMRVPKLVIVGENDTLSAGLETSPMAMLQGANRLERAKNYVAAFEKILGISHTPGALSIGKASLIPNSNIRLVIVKGAGHSDTPSKSIAMIEEFLFE
jgi:hypothetical protein